MNRWAHPVQRSIRSTMRRMSPEPRISSIEAFSKIASPHLSQMHVVVFMGSFLGWRMIDGGQGHLTVQLLISTCPQTSLPILVGGIGRKVPRNVLDDRGG